MVRRLDDVQIVLDDQHRVTRLHQPLENFNQLVNVGSMEARGGLVQNIDGAARGGSGQFRGQLHTLGFAAGEGGAGLAQLDVAQAHIHHGLDLLTDLGDVFEEFQGLVGGHVQHLGNVLALVLDFQRLPVVSCALADFARDVDVRQEVHLDLHQAVAGAGFASAALDVEGETAGAVAADLGVIGGGKEVADVVEEARVSGRIGTGGAADGALVDIDDLVQMLQAVHAAASTGTGAGMVQLAQQGLVENFVDQTGLAGAGHAGDAG